MLYDVVVTSEWTAVGSRLYADQVHSVRAYVRDELILRGVCEAIGGTPQRVLDLGGGDGQLAVELVRRGHRVTVLDTDEDMRRRAGGVLGRCDQLREGEELFDVTCCHGLMPFVDTLQPLLAAMTSVTEPGGWVSLVGLNAHALAIFAGMANRWYEVDAVRRAWQGEGPRLLAPATLMREQMWADYVPFVESALAGCGVDVRTWRGIRVYTENRYDPVDPSHEDVGGIVDWEWAAGAVSPTRDVAGLFHVLGCYRPDEATRSSAGSGVGRD